MYIRKSNTYTCITYMYIPPFGEPLLAAGLPDEPMDSEIFSVLPGVNFSF